MSGGIDTVLVAYCSEEIIAEAVVRAKELGGTVVVVDHSIASDSVGAATAAGAITVTDPTNPGFGTGQNNGVARTASPYVLLCNPDAEIEPAAVLDGAAFLDAHPGVAAVQGVVMNRATGTPERSQGMAVRPVHLLGRAVGARRLLAHPAVRRLAQRSVLLRDHADRVPTGPVAVEALAATVLLVRRAAFESVGGFDSRYFLYGEDLDLCRRLRAGRWELVALPDVWAVHESGGSAHSTLSRELHWWAGTMQYAARWWTTADWSLAVVAATVRMARIVGSHPHRARSVASSLLTGPMHERLDQRSSYRVCSGIA